MNPKQPAQLDPKLQEAYDRVMGTAINPVLADASAPAAVAATPLTPPQITPPSPTPVMAPNPTTPAAPTPANSATQPLPTPVVMPHSPETVRIGGGISMQPIPSAPAANAPQTQTIKKGMSPMLIIVGAIVFLLAYSVFWIKFLNVPLPFQIPFLSQ